MKKVCIITGTRAEYSALRPVLFRFQEDQSVELQLLVTGMHLSPEFGLTYKEIERDGFVITERNEMLLSADTVSGVTKSMGLAMIGFADNLARLNPDIVIVSGDRYEIFAAVSAAMLARIPVVHLHGGEITEGAIDDAIRHAITKMSSLHFTSTEEYRKRVIQLGENPQHVYCVGALSVENIKNQKLLSKLELEKSIDFKLDKPYFVITYHPVTIEENSAQMQFVNLLKALDKIEGYHYIFTKSNADAEGRIINELIESYVEKNKEKAIGVTSLGMVRYLSALKYCEMVIGNSSSGLVEAPSFHVPTVNIGNRQKGRVRAKTVVDCGYKEQDIINAMETALKMKVGNEIQKIVNPYEGENTSKRVYETIKMYLDSGMNELKSKKFYDVNIGDL